MDEKWRRGHISRFWDTNEIKKFDYVRQPITQQEIDEWVAKGYDHVKSYSGMMYDNRNPMPEWVFKFKDLFHTFKNMTFTFYNMSTLEIMPEHSDHYATYIRLFKPKQQNIHRILVMLEDWKPGHYLEVDGVGVVNWIAGDYFIWKNDCKHAASNIGVEDRYSLQITAEEIDSSDTWQKLHWINIPDMESKRASSLYYMRRIRNAIPKEIIDKPMFLYMYNGALTDIKELNHDEHTKQTLNDRGLVFYLTEPLCSYLEGAAIIRPPHGTKHTMSFYSEFTGYENSEQFRADELDSIKDYVIRNKLTNVTVYTCDGDANKWYPYYSDYMRIDTDDLFVKAVMPKQIVNPEVEPTFTNKFMCLNWRYTPHRHLTAAYVSLFSSKVSWYFRGDLGVVGRHSWTNVFDIQQKNPEVFFKLIKGIETLNKKAPMNVDLEIIEPVTITDTYFKIVMPDSQTIHNHTSIHNDDIKIEEAYRDIFCDVVTESRFAQPTGNYSEKTFHPMWYKKPFVLVAPPNTLKLLKEHGYKTFNDFWDESYDDIQGNEERLFKIFETIESINSKSIEELQDMYTKMKPILEHNFKIVKERLK
jgi:hypothetical protein